MKKFSSSLLCLAVLLSTSAAVNALEIKKPSLGTAAAALTGSNNANKTAMKSQIKTIINKSDEITATYNQAIENIANILLTQDEIAKIKAEKNVLSDESKSKEKGATQALVYADYAALITADDKLEEMTQRTKKLSAEKTNELLNCIYNVTLASLGYLDIANQSSALLNQITADPLSAATLGADLKNLKNIVTNMPAQAKAVGNISTGLVKIATNSGLKVAKPSDAASKPKTRNDFDK